ncbi:MAG: S26 family signal peptidase [Planctomycetaceae bacterium]|nr:S26 family signal peptidase [Planctomycetaceae bacterium]
MQSNKSTICFGISREEAKFRGSERAEILARIEVRIHGDSMWPTLCDGDKVEAFSDLLPQVGDIVVAKHPWKDLHIVKRVKRIQTNGYFLEGDNPDPTGTEDSHNFGPVPATLIIAAITQ